MSRWDEKYDRLKPWYDQKETLVSTYWLKPPYNDVCVGSDPGDGMTKEFADQFDAIVNVSSTRCATFEPSRPDQRTYWFPIVELSRWPMVYLLWLKEVMNFHYEKGHKIYLHCHAGAFRSPSAACLWIESRGHDKMEALKLGSYRGDSSHLYRIQERNGNIPKEKDLIFQTFHEQEKLIKENGYGTLCIESILTYEMKLNPWSHQMLSGDNRRRHLLHHYFWFYFEPKWWIKDKWTRFKEWAFKRYGRLCEGSGTYLYTRRYFWAWSDGAEPVPYYAERSEGVGHWKWNSEEKRWETFEKWNSKTLSYDKVELGSEVYSGNRKP